MFPPAAIEPCSALSPRAPAACHGLNHDATTRHSPGTFVRRRTIDIPTGSDRPAFRPDPSCRRRIRLPRCAGAPSPGISHTPGRSDRPAARHRRVNRRLSQVRHQRQYETSDGDEQAQHATQLVSPVKAQKRHEHGQSDDTRDSADQAQQLPVSHDLMMAHQGLSGDPAASISATDSLGVWGVTISLSTT